MLIAESKEFKFYHVVPGQVFSIIHSNRKKNYMLDGQEELLMRCEATTDKAPIQVVNLRTGKLQDAPPVYQMVRVYNNAIINLNDV